MLESLDALYYSQTNQPQFPSVEAYATQFAKQLKPTCAIIINGSPVIPEPPANDSRLAFQKKWLQLPSTLHQITSVDGHLIPGTGQFSLIVSGKVRFDESAMSRLGESAEIEPPQRRMLWGPWCIFHLSIMADESIAQGSQTELINTFNYRIVYSPPDSVVRV